MLTYPLLQKKSSKFNPYDFNNINKLLVLDGDSNKVIKSGSNITQWNDETLNLSFTGVSSPQLITNELNGKSVVRFDGTSYFFNENTDLSNLITDGFSIYTIFNPTGRNQTAQPEQFTEVYVFSHDNINPGSRMVQALYDKDGFVYATWHDASAISSSRFSYNVGWQLHSYRSKYSDIGQVRVNGNVLSSHSVGAKPPRTFSHWYIGSRSWSVPGIQLIGDIAYLLMIPNYVDENLNLQIEGDLCHRFNLENNLPLTHPFKNSAP